MGCPHGNCYTRNSNKVNNKVIVPGYSSTFAIVLYIRVSHRGLGLVRDMVFNATFNNISVITWRLDLLVEETGVSVENDTI